MSLLAPHRRGRHSAAAVTELSEATSGNPIALSIQLAEARTQGRIAESSVQARARTLHAENSFASWDALTDTEKRLWRHLARVEFLGDLSQWTPSAARG